MKRLAPSLLSLGLFLLAVAPSQGGVVRKIRDVGPDENRLVIGIVGDGYLASQEDAFVANAEQALAGFLAESPYREYAGWINAYAVFEASNEEGADKPAACFGSDTVRDTFFDATYCSSNIRRLLTVRTATVFSVLNADVPTWDVAAVVVNDREYGGAGGSVLTFSTDAGAMIELFLHEAGHTFGRLADEYGGDPGPFPGGEPREPNVTLELDRDLTKWAPWIEPATPLPTPGSMNWTVGLYEGGRYHDAAIWRPVNNCKMRSLNRAFCPICKESHVQEIHARVRPIDGASPAEPAIDVPPCGSVEVALDLLPVEPPTLEVEWRIDGVPIPGETDPSLTLEASLVPPGGGELEAFVFDATPLVRRPYLTPMTDRVTWALTAAAASDLDGDGIDDGCDPDIDGDDIPNDADCAPRDAAIGSPAREVSDLRVSAGPAGAALLSWEDVIALEGRPSGVYALLSGRVAELRADAGFDRACRLSHDDSPARADDRPLPASGTASWWYLVAVEDACGTGDLGASPPPAADARAALDPATLPGCP